MSKKSYSSISKILNDAKKGKMFILVDDEGRENEGDLIVPASKISPKSISFMAKFGRGLICLALTSDQVNKLNLSLMSPKTEVKLLENFSDLNSDGVVCGAKEYPVTIAPTESKRYNNHDPLKPVCPVTNIRLPL